LQNKFAIQLNLINVKYHILGINKSSLQTFTFLKKKYLNVSISDKKIYSDIKKKLKKIKISKSFFFGFHPKNKIDTSNYIIYASGIIKNDSDYKDFLKNKKNISEIDIFYKYKNWPINNILLITGSRGKTTIAKIVFNQLRRKKLFRKVIIMDRKKINFANIPYYKEGFFLIIEMDYQSLLIAKKIEAKFRVITSYYKSENKVLSNEDLYKHAKLKIFQNIKKNQIIFLNKKTFMKLSPKINIFKENMNIIYSNNSIIYNNNLLSKNIINKILESFRE